MTQAVVSLQSLRLKIFNELKEIAWKANIFLQGLKGIRQWLMYIPN